MTPRYTDPTGRTWKVRDVCHGVPPSTPGRAIKLPLGDPRATSRIFLPGDGRYDGAPGSPLIRSYRLSEERDTALETFAAQFRQVASWDPRPPEVIAAARGVSGAGHMSA